MTGTGIACKMTGCSTWKTDQDNTLWLLLADRHGVGHYQWTPAEGHVGFPIFRTSATAAFCYDITSPFPSFEGSCVAMLSRITLAFSQDESPGVKMCLQ